MLRRGLVASVPPPIPRNHELDLSLDDLDISGALEALSDAESPKSLVQNNDAVDEIRQDQQVTAAEVPQPVVAPAKTENRELKKRKNKFNEEKRFKKTKILGTGEEVVLDLNRTVQYIDPDKTVINKTTDANFRDRFLADYSEISICWVYWKFPNF
jgi:hypothetical protein